jgi:NADPH-dependent glutamate synthase beta subunit-like oxidoreductase
MDKPFAITLDPASSLADKTGSWRTERPVYTRRVAPCAHACPAGEDAQAWLFHAEEGDYERAWRTIMDVNPFPAVMGRVCYHACETACNRGQLDEAVGINSVERFLGDEAIRAGWRVDPPATRTGKRVLIVGAGPSGLAAAYHLALAGHDVVVHDSGDEPGGMMRYGIPAYRLPRDILDAEIARIAGLGVELHLGSKVEDLEATVREERCDAAFVAVGAHLGKRAYLPAGSAARILDAVAMLRDVADGEPPQLGRRVVVYGGGNTALDAARTARRLGAEEAVIVYRRTRDRAPAHDSEIQEALEEGVLVKWLSTVQQADGDRLTIERMELDDDGFPRPTGEFEELEADSLVLALGQESDLGLLQRTHGIEIRDGVVEVAPDLMTGHPGVFAGGDIVPAERTVTMAIGHGRTVAASIDAWMRGERATPSAPEEPMPVEALNTWYYTDAPRSIRPTLELARRQSTFDEVLGGLDSSTALFEARRCLSCGSCFGCDNCFGVCPDNAVIKLDPAGAYAYAVDLDYCKGCGMCAEECPCGAIVMEPEEV